MLDGPAGKRLHPALPEVVASLERGTATCTGSIRRSSPRCWRSRRPRSTAHWLARTGLVARKPISHTRPGSSVKSSIPMKSWGEWNDAEPGFLQIGLVGHDGGDNG